MRSNTGNQTTPGQPHINIIDDYEDDYVEVTGVDEDVEDGWEEVMVASSPPTRKANITTPNILPNTITTTTTTTTTKVTTIPQPIPTQPKAIINNIATITAIPQPVPTQPIAIVNNNVASNNNVINKVQEVLVERVVSVPSQPKEVLQDPDWLAALKANKVPYSATTQGDPQYTAPYGMFRCLWVVCSLVSFVY